MKKFEKLHNALQQMINRTNTMQVPANENKDADLILAQGIKEHKEMRDAIKNITPWLSASLSDDNHEPCKEYTDAVNTILKLDNINNLKYDDKVRSFLFDLANLIGRYDNVKFSSYANNDDGIHVIVNNTTIKLGYGLDITPQKLCNIADSHY